MANAVNRFNLIDENWIPLAGQGLISLRTLFSNTDQGALGGNPMEKVALTKLFLAIAQAACTPNDDEGWHKLGTQGLAKACLDYLNTWHDSFWLYGERPFLQMPAIKKAQTQSFGALQPHISSGNTTILQDLQKEQPLADAQLALLLTLLTGYGLSGKKTDNSLVLSPGYQGKTKDGGKAISGRAGPWIGYMGYLHHFLVGQNLLESIWFNLLTQEDIELLDFLPQGIGKPPWETGLQGEACPAALALQNSLMGRLVPCSKFCLINETKMHYTDGIAYPSHKDGWVDTSIARLRNDKEVKVLWVNPPSCPGETYLPCWLF